MAESEARELARLRDQAVTALSEFSSTTHVPVEAAQLLTLLDRAEAGARYLAGLVHSHVTRDVRPRGECLACDQHHARQDARDLATDNAALIAGLEAERAFTDHLVNLLRGVEDVTSVAWWRTYAVPAIAKWEASRG